MGVARRQPVEKIARPFQDLAEKQSSGGIFLITATIAALAWANSPWGEGYEALWHTKFTVSVGDFSLSKDLTHWINDGLMAIFFLVGLEIKREVLVGELSSVRGAASRGDRLHDVALYLRPRLRGRRPGRHGQARHSCGLPDLGRGRLDAAEARDLPQQTRMT